MADLTATVTIRHNDHPHAADYDIVWPTGITTTVNEGELVRLGLPVPAPILTGTITLTEAETRALAAGQLDLSTKASEIVATWDTVVEVPIEAVEPG